MSSLAVEAIGLEKSYGTVRVLDGVDLDVAAGQRVRPARPERGRQDHHRAHPGHADRAPTPAGPGWPASTSSRDRRQVRRRISLTGQYAAVDDLQTGEENLRMMGAAGRPARRPGPPPGGRAAGAVRPGRRRPAARSATYSGGMRRRLDLAAGLVGQPVGDLPRRADHRPRPAQPPGDVAGRRRPGRIGGDRVPHHPVPGGGRPAGRPHRRARRRPGGRRGHPGPAQAAGRRASASTWCWPTRAAFDELARAPGRPGRPARPGAPDHRASPPTAAPPRSGPCSTRSTRPGAAVRPVRRAQRHPRRRVPRPDRPPRRPARHRPARRSPPVSELTAPTPSTAAAPSPTVALPTRHHGRALPAPGPAQPRRRC